MPNSLGNALFIEISELTVQLVRARGHTIELYRECLRDQRDDILQALKEGSPKGEFSSSPVLAAISPSRSFSYLASEDECRQLQTPGEIVRHIEMPCERLVGPIALAACNADDGRSINASARSRWLLVGSGQEVLAASQAYLSDLGLKETIISPAVTNHLGALQTACQLSGAPSSVLVWDLGRQSSTFHLVNRKGVLAVRGCSVGLDHVADAIQAELSLASRGAAAKLFLNSFFDFADTGPKVVKRLLPEVKAAVKAVGGDPSSIFCLGLPSDNIWFAHDVGILLGLTPWHPAITSLAQELGVDFVGNSLVNRLGFNAAGLLHMVGSRAGGSDCWHPAWQMIEIEAKSKVHSGQTAPASSAREAEALVTPGVGAGVPESAHSFAARTHTQSESRPAATSVLAQATARAKALTSPTPPAENIAVRQAPTQKSPTARALAASVLTQTETKALLSDRTTKHVETHPLAKPEEQSATSLQHATNEVATSSPPPPASPKVSPSAEASKPDTPGDATKEKGGKRPIALFVAITAVLAVGVAGWFTFDAHRQQEIAQTLRVEAEKRAADALAKARQEEEAARLETERLRKEAEIEREKAVAAVRLRTEQEILERVEAERRENAPGILVVRTDPTGAHVSIDGALPQATPLTTNSLSIGTHSLAISLPGYDTTTRTVEIKRDHTTDLGLIELMRQVGRLEILSEPAGLTFELRQSTEQPESKPIQTGVTPATLNDLIVGDYVVTLLRTGWKPVTATAKISSLSTTQVVPLFATSRLTVSSTPAGAIVMRDGEVMGTTPLQLSELEPGEYTFDLSLAEHDSATITTRIKAGSDSEVTASLLPFDRILKTSEIAKAPVAIKTVAPDYESRGRDVPEEAVISCVIDRDGVPRSLNVEKTSSVNFGNACLVALAKWRFKPATTNSGRTANVRVSVPFNAGSR